MLMELSDAAARHGTLFHNAECDERSARLMRTLDILNRQYGQGTVHLGSAGMQQRWALRSENRTSNYTIGMGRLWL